MLRNKKAKYKEQPEISTASLPDIVFILLFFFMVATVMRNDVLLIDQELPEADLIEKLEKKDLLMNVYVGKPSSRYQTGNTESWVQLNDKLANIAEIKPFVIAEREKKNEAIRPFMVTALKIDRKTKMGLVGDIKKALREVDALRINYSTINGNKKQE